MTFVLHKFHDITEFIIICTNDKENLCFAFDCVDDGVVVDGGLSCIGELMCF